MITPVELRAIRQYFFLTPAEIAEEIGKTGEEWEQYEVGTSRIPLRRVEMALYRLARWRAKTSAKIFNHMVDHGRQTRAVLLWYDRKEDMPGNVSTARWRIHQSICAEHIANERTILQSRIVTFDPIDYAYWLAENRHQADTEATRAMWAKTRIESGRHTLHTPSPRFHPPLRAHH